MKDESFISLTALGQIYGVAAQDVGRWLKGLSLRNEDGYPCETCAIGCCREGRPYRKGGRPV